MQSQKHTAWKKNRKFGDVWGGRKRPKMEGRVFNRQHNLSAPKEGEEKPIFIVENPSKDFYFPVTVDEVREVLGRLPRAHTEHLTHIWFQRIKKRDFLAGRTFQASFICGCGVYLIVLHPFPVDNKMRFGKEKPTRKTLNEYEPFTTDLNEDKDGWYLQWTEESINRYFLESLLLYEVGYSLESFHRDYWSKASQRKVEHRAENYSRVWGNAKMDAQS